MPLINLKHEWEITKMKQQKISDGKNQEIIGGTCPDQCSDEPNGPPHRHSEPENFKKSRPKKLVKSNKSISRKNFFDQNPFFAISKMAKNQFLNWEKV